MRYFALFLIRGQKRGYYTVALGLKDEPTFHVQVMANRQAQSVKAEDKKKKN